MESQKEIFDEKEATGIQWFTISEIEDESLGTFEETRMWCRRFYNM
jgi:hypothetical protein